MRAAEKSKRDAMVWARLWYSDDGQGYSRTGTYFQAKRASGNKLPRILRRIQTGNCINVYKVNVTFLRKEIMQVEIGSWIEFDASGKNNWENGKYMSYLETRRKNYVWVGI